MGYSPIYVRLLHMFENFQDLHHCINIDKILNLVNFTIAIARYKTNVRTQGDLCTSNFSTPPCVYQEEVGVKQKRKLIVM